MGIFGRIADLFKSNVNDMIDKAENPEKMLKQMIIEMEEGVTKSTAALAKAMANEQNMLRQLNVAKTQVQEWEQKAINALKSGNQDMAKQALEKKVQFAKQAEQFEAMHKQTSENTSNLRNQLTVIKAKLEEARGKMSLLSARAQMADTQKEFANTIGGTNSNSALAKFEKMENKVMMMEAEAQASSELAGAQMTEDPFSNLEKNQQVEDEMAKLIAKMNGGA